MLKLRLSAEQNADLEMTLSEYNFPELDAIKGSKKKLLEERNRIDCLGIRDIEYTLKQRKMAKINYLLKKAIGSKKF